MIKKPLLETEGSLENLPVPTILPSPSGCRLVVFIYAFLEAAGPTKLIIVSDFFPAALLSSAHKLLCITFLQDREIPTGFAADGS